MRRSNRAGICEMRKRTASGKSTSCWRLSFWRFSIGFRIITALFHTSERVTLVPIFYFIKISHLFHCSSFSQKVTLGLPARLQACSRRLAVATNFLRVRESSTPTSENPKISFFQLQKEESPRVAGTRNFFIYLFLRTLILAEIQFCRH